MTRRMRGFKRWMRAQGFEYSDALELVDSPDEGISVRALHDLREGDAVATIPKRACLTIKNSGARQMIAKAGLEGHLGLSLAVMYERSLGIASPWHGYLQILPEKECAPLVWSGEEIDALLFGTELHKIVKEDKKLVHEDWKEFIEPLIEAGDWGLNPSAFGVDQYFSAKTLVASRSFEIDAYHGYGMVPFADLFNHKTGLENVHFTAPSSSSSSDDDDDDDDDDEDDHGHEHDDDDDDDEDHDDHDVDDNGKMEMVVVRGVEAGDEVFNTYGSMGNAALLHRYGFTEIDNSFDIVNIDLSLVLQWSSSSFSSRHTRARLSLWRRLSFSGCASQNSEYFEISSEGEPQLELLVLLYIIFLPEEAYEKLNQAADYSTDAGDAEDDDDDDEDAGGKAAAEVVILNTAGGGGGGGGCGGGGRRRSRWRSDPDPRGFFLTEEVCGGLLGLADAREGLYGTESLEEDVARLGSCRRVKDRKLHDSLVLRVAERRILRKLRAYASGRWKTKRKKREELEEPLRGRHMTSL